MADDVDNQEPRIGADASPGVRLRAAREAQNLTTQAIARDMHLDTWMLDAIERDEYSALGAPVFAKGHLRKYASVLGLDPNELMVAYYQVDGTRETQPVIAESILRVEAEQAPRFAWLLPTAIVLAAGASVAAAALWYMRADVPRPVSAAVPDQIARPQNTTTGRSATLSLPQAQTAAVDTPPDGDADAATAGDDAPAVTTPAGPQASVSASGGRDVAAQDVAATVTAPAATPAAAAPPVAVDGVTLTLRFRTESWVEVYDANRRKLLYGLGVEGTVQYLSGPPPIAVFLGRASGVDVEVNGQPYEMPAGSRRGNTARFRVTAP